MNRTIPIEVLDGGNSLYVSEGKVYPRDVRGRLQNLRIVAVAVLLGLFYGLPWLRWGDRQAVLFDLPARRFHVFALEFWPQDFVFLALLLIIAGLALFFFTTVAGRLWCGYACPQTVWTEVFLWMERWTEGDRARRIKLDAAPWSLDKLRRKGAKHALWAVFALWTGFTFVGFFTPITELAARAWPFAGAGTAWSGWEVFWVLFYAVATWGNAGFLREQVCKYMCPYARFQSAMFDRDTLLIAYDPMRGEPRGPRRRGVGSVLQRGRALLDKAIAYDLVFRAGQHPTAADAAVHARGTAPPPEGSPIEGTPLQRLLADARCSTRRPPTISCSVPANTRPRPMPRCMRAAPRRRRRARRSKAPRCNACSPTRSERPHLRRSLRPSRSATASTARSACRSVRPASTSVMACNTSASLAAPASMPATG
jgi:hypothetical protein